MKLFSLISFIALFAFISSGKPEEKWCGSSFVFVSISHQDNDGDYVTKGKIVVPLYLKDLKEETYHEKNSQSLRQTIIEKHEEGLLIDTTGFSIHPKHMNYIFRNDQDDKNVVYIPYLYIKELSSDVKEKKNIIIYMSRTFSEEKKSENLKVTLTFLPFEHNVSICDCQYDMFLKQLTKNHSKRKDIIETISDYLLKSVRSYVLNQRSLKMAILNKSELDEKIILETSVIETNQKKITIIYTLIQSIIEKIKELQITKSQLKDPCVELRNKIIHLNTKLEKLTSEIIELDSSDELQTMTTNFAVSRLVNSLENLLPQLENTPHKSIVSKIQSSLPSEIEAARNDKNGMIVVELKKMMEKLDRYLDQIKAIEELNMD